MNVYTPTNVIVHDVDVHFESRIISKPIHVVQYDDRLPVVKVNLYTGNNGDEEYELPEGADVNIRYCRPDGHVVYNPVLGKDSTSNNVVYFEITQAMLIKNGKGRGVLEVTLNGKLACSSEIIFEIDRNPIQEESIEATDEFKSVVQYAAEAETAASSIRDLTVEAITGEPGTEATVVKSGGTGPEDPYHLQFTIPKGESGSAGNISVVAEEYSASKTYKEGQFVMHNNDLYVAKVDISTAEAWNANHWIRLNIGDALYNQQVEIDHKADIDGSYEDLTAGSAEQLLSSVYVEDSTPYSFRTSGGNLEIGNREEQRKIVGASVVQNQLINPNSSQSSGTTDGVTVTNNKDGSYTLTGTKTSNANTYYYLMYSLPVGSKYVICGANTANAGGGGASGGYNLFCAYLNAGTSFTKQQGSQPIIINPSDTTKEGWRLQLQIGYANGAINTYNDTIRPMVINLTQRFGAEFADWLYSLSRAKYTEILYQLIPELNGGFIPYNTGVIGSVNVSKHIMTGFNQYNPNTDVVRVIRGNQYQITGSYTSLTGEDGSTITPDANGYFTPTKTQAVSVAGGNSTDTCVHLVWDGERDGEFEEYKTHEYDYDSSVELRGMLRVDENGNIYADGDEYNAGGSVNGRWGIKNLGDCNWQAGFGSNTYYTTDLKTLIKPFAIKSIPTILLSRVTWPIVPCNSSINVPIGITVYPDNVATYTGYILARNDSIASASAMKSALQNVWIIYPLATPTEETANPFTETQVVDNWSTEEFVDAQGRDFVIPVGHVTDYPQDLRAKLETVPNAPSENGDYLVRQSNSGTEYVPYTDGAKIDALEEDVSENTQDISDLEKSIDDIPDYVFTGFDIKSISVVKPWAEGGKIVFDDNIGYIAKSDGQVNNAGSGTWIYSDFIPLDRLDGTVGDFVVHSLVACVAYYSSASFDTYLGNLSITDNENNTFSKADVLTNAPSGAKYIVICTDGSREELYANLTPAETEVKTNVQNLPVFGRKIMHISFDDTNNAFADLTTNADTYTSLFDSPFFAVLKEMHDTYGAVFSCYCFYNVYTDDTRETLVFSLANCTTKFKDEFEANSDWLRFGFHSIDNYKEYTTVSESDATADWNTFINGIIPVVGLKSIDTLVRTQSFTGGQNACRGFRNGLCGARGFLSSDYSETGENKNIDSSNGYYMSAAQSKICGRMGKYYEPTEALYFFPSNWRIDWQTDLPGYLALFNTADRFNRSRYMIMYGHENTMTQSAGNIAAYRTKLITICQWANNNGYLFVFPADLISY